MQGDVGRGRLSDRRVARESVMERDRTQAATAVRGRPLSAARPGYAPYPPSILSTAPVT